MNRIKGFFRAISQSFFFDNAGFGACLLSLLLVFDPDFFVCGAVAAVIGYAYSLRYSTPRVLKDCGLITINCFFFGIAMASLFRETPAFYACLVLGAMGIPLLTKAAYEVLQHWKLSPLITPYILMVWIIWLSGQGAALELQPESWPGRIPYLPELNPEWEPALRVAASVFQSMGRLLFLPSPTFGLSVLALVTAFSPRRGLFFLAGTVVATVTAFFMSAGSASWEHGYFGYSAGLIGLGLASFPEKFAWRTIFLFCALSAFITMAVEEFLQGLQLPALSLPYVLTLWIALLSRVPRLNLSWARKAE